MRGHGLAPIANVNFTRSSLKPVESKVLQRAPDGSVADGESYQNAVLQPQNGPFAE